MESFVVFAVSVVAAYACSNAWRKYTDSVVQSTAVGLLGGLGAGMLTSTALSLLR